MSNNLIDRFLSSRYPKKINKSYLKVLHRDLRIELMKYHLNADDYSCKIKLSPVIENHIKLQDRYMRCCIPIRKISNDLMEAIIDDKQFCDNMLVSYDNDKLKVHWLDYRNGNYGKADYSWLMTYKLFTCLLEALNINGNGKKRKMESCSEIAKE